ncbi:MAG: YkvI family membrane protein [Cetobacterium sp.]|uniref:YkvI family membrane protein n=1 Tax=Cetobacterium sp. TaxID=2071632 RepID=UPI003F4016BB
MERPVSVKKIIIFAGSIIAFLIGSGFATGQEVLQYFAAYGYWGIGGALLTLILLMYVCSSFLIVGYREQFNKGNDIYKYYCGEKLGTCFDYFSTFFCFLSFIVMIAGAGATLNQHYNLSPIFGGIIISVLALITVLAGLSNLVDIIGKIGPTIVIISICLGLFSLVKNHSSLSPHIVIPALESLEANSKLIKASSSWYLASFSYVGFCMLWLAGFLASLGKKASSSLEAKLGGSFGGILFSCAVIVVALGLLSTIEITAGTQIPMLYLANDVHNMFSSFFALIIMAGIYSTAVPLLWNVSSRFTEEKTKSFNFLTVALAIVGLVIGIWIPFDKLVNIIYVINGYFGGILLLIMVLRTIKNIFIRKEKIYP